MSPKKDDISSLKPNRFLLQKLYSFVKGGVCSDNPDATSNHELLLPGQLFQAFFKVLKDAYPEYKWNKSKMNIFSPNHRLTLHNIFQKMGLKSEFYI